MKKLILTYLFLSSFSLAQWNTGAIKIGYFNPQATEGGFIFGFEGGNHIDKLLNWSWSLDWFHRSYIDKKLIKELNQYYPGAVGEINELRASTNIHDFPIMIGLTTRFPISRYSHFYLNGALGAELLLINYRNFQDPVQDEFEAAFDFNWRISVGATIAFGPRSEFFGEISYHKSNPSWSYEDDGYIYPERILERSYNMSGFMSRIGIRFFY